MNLRECTEAEFDAFVKTYPRPLKRDVWGAHEPPLVTLNDFVLAPKWPGSVVACYCDFDLVDGEIVTRRNGFKIASNLGDINGSGR